MISVIIATMNRAEALAKISLPSLMRQKFTPFEVIVWDASDSRDSQEVCEAHMDLFHTINSHLRYFKASRKGSASQRNDAVKKATGEVVFFMDDDCELSNNGLSVLQSYFESFPWLCGAALPMLNKTPASGTSRLLKFATLLFGFKNRSLERKINSHGGLSLPIKDLHGPAEWLSGGSMAFKKTMLETIHFDERLETFGGYALGEDYDISYRIFLASGQPHLITNGGYVVHHAAEGGRIKGKEAVAAHFFNKALIRRNFSKYGRRFNVLAILWGSLGTVLFLLKSGVSISNLVQGFLLAKQTLSKIDKSNIE